MSRLDEYRKYHSESTRIGDVDPSNAMARYVADRYELSMEQRFWCAWLYAATYNGASMFYLYNEAPDAENVDIGRLNRWWFDRGRECTTFTTDRRWCRSRNQFVDAVASYRRWVGNRTQEEHFHRIASGDTPEKRYDQLFRSMESIFTFGPFTRIIYLDVLSAVTNLQITATDFDFAAAWSVRFGMFFAFGKDEWVTDKESPLLYHQKEPTQEMWGQLKELLPPQEPIASIETTLCAYRKYHRGKRWIGYYLDRQALEIAKMRANVPDGVCWDVLEQYRRETYHPAELVENYYDWDHLAKKGLPDRWKLQRQVTTREAIK